VFRTALQQVQYYDKYAKWIREEYRKETWHETCDRVIAFLQAELTKLGKQIPDDMWQELRLAMYNGDVMPSMRIVQMAGPALERCHVGAYNCAYLPMDKPTALVELLYVLMQGTGCGYSVERRYTNLWPTVPKHEYGVIHDGPKFVTVEDSTEGWCDAFKVMLEEAFAGRYKPIYDLSKIRPEGAWLNTKGGRASGPKPLRDLLDFTWDLLFEARGRKLRPFEVHRLACMVASIVMVGGVRRSAMICLSDLNDSEMRDCKKGAFWERYPELSMSNNSAVYETKPDDFTFQMEWEALAASGTGERGIFNRAGTFPKRRKGGYEWGLNPCGEIKLRPRQFCNLTIAVARPDDTEANLQRKVRLATLFGTIQSCLTSFNYLPKEWKTNCEEERLLGVDIAGTMDCPLLNKTNTYTALLLSSLKQVALNANEEYAKMLGIPVSASVTCNKPSGNSSQLFDVASGIHPRYAQYYIRRMRIQARSPLANYLVERGVPHAPEVGQGELHEARVWVFEFPVKSPDQAVTRHDITAKEQFRYWLMWKKFWTEHNPSCTIYVDTDEWTGMGKDVLDQWEFVGGLSFLPKSDHAYMLAPYEEIKMIDWMERVAEFPELDLSVIVETQNTTEQSREFSCSAGHCEL
jgi:ribonucleoside-triphosphate reductase (thioredoxin)